MEIYDLESLRLYSTIVECIEAQSRIIMAISEKVDDNQDYSIDIKGLTESTNAMRAQLEQMVEPNQRPFLKS